MSSSRRVSFVLVTAVGVLLSALPGAALAVADASAPSAISITSKLGCVETVIASIHPSLDMHTGDRVRVCLPFMPTKDVSPQGCDPATDPRGRRFVIVDRVTGTVAQYYDGIHLCGGA